MNIATLSAATAMAAMPVLAMSDTINDLNAERFQRHDIYLLFGQELEAYCDCDKDGTGQFGITVLAAQENLFEARIIATDMGSNACREHGFDAVSVHMEEYFEQPPNSWIFAGSCQ